MSSESRPGRRAGDSTDAAQGPAQPASSRPARETKASRENAELASGLRWVYGAFLIALVVLLIWVAQCPRKAGPGEPADGVVVAETQPLGIVSTPAGASLAVLPEPGPSLRPGTQRTFSGIDFVWISPGSFTMGSPEEEPGRQEDEGRRAVRITKGFWMAKYELTEIEYCRLVQDDGAVPEAGWRPLSGLSWQDSQAILSFLNEASEGLFRLPTEAEWEYACRAGTSSAYYFGEDPWPLRMHAWCAEEPLDYVPDVGGKQANPWGLYDMYGGVLEHCSDWYGALLADSGDEAVDPDGPRTGVRRVLRGGDWTSPAPDCRSARRFSASPRTALPSAGLRLVREADE